MKLNSYQKNKILEAIQAIDSKCATIEDFFSQPVWDEYVAGLNKDVTTDEVQLLSNGKKPPVSEGQLELLKQSSTEIVNGCKHKTEVLERIIHDGFNTLEEFIKTKEENPWLHSVVGDELLEEIENGLSTEEIALSIKNAHEKTAEEILEEHGYDDVLILKDESYDSALVGVTSDNRAVYSYNKMVEWYMNKNNSTSEEAMEWIDYNTIRALPYMGAGAPIVMFDLED